MNCKSNARANTMDVLYKDSCFYFVEHVLWARDFCFIRNEKRAVEWGIVIEDEVHFSSNELLNRHWGGLVTLIIIIILPKWCLLFKIIRIFPLWVVVLGDYSRR